MPYKDKEKQREFQRRWMEKRRIEYLANKKCEACRRNKATVIASAKTSGKHFSFSYSKAVINKKLESASVLCDACFKPYKANRASQKAFKHGHAKASTPVYITWRAMLERCYNASKDNYKWYGGRGVEVCERWHTFENFLADMGERPYNMTLDRKNPHGNYEPDNCRWATPKEQGRNKRRNIKPEV